MDSTPTDAATLAQVYHYVRSAPAWREDPSSDDVEHFSANGGHCWNMRVSVKLAHVAVQVTYSRMDAHSRVRLWISNK